MELGSLPQVFVVGSGWFVFLLVVSFLYIYVQVVRENGRSATACLLITLTLLDFFGNVPVFATIAAHPLTAVGVLLAYFLGGFLSARAEWWFFVTNELNKLQELMDTFLAARGAKGSKVVPKELEADWFKLLDRYYNGHTPDDVTPQVTEHKNLIIFWMSFWPLSLSWRLLNDPVRRAFRRMYEFMKNSLQEQANRIFEQIAKTLPAVNVISTLSR